MLQKDWLSVSALTFARLCVQVADLPLSISRVDFTYSLPRSSKYEDGDAIEELLAALKKIRDKPGIMSAN